MDTTVELIKAEKMTETKMASAPVSEHLAIMEQLIASGIISPARFDAISTTLKRVPHFRTNCIGIERPLGSEDPQIDVSLSIDPQIDVSELEALQKISEQPAKWSKNAAWQRLSEFAKLWPETLSQRIKDMWLEFDVTPPLSEISVPSVFFSMKNADRGSISWLTECTLPTLLGTPLPVGVGEQLKLCFDLLPEQGSITHCATMLTRKPIYIRILIELTPVQIVPYLNLIEWNGDEAFLTTVIQELVPLVDTFVLAIDVKETIGRKLGIECFLKQNKNTRADWTSIIDYFSQKSLCTPLESLMLRNLKPARYRVRNTNIPQSNQEVKKVNERSIEYGINHFKLVIQKETLAAKAYLYLMNFAH